MGSGGAKSKGRCAAYPMHAARNNHAAFMEPAMNPSCRDESKLQHKEQSRDPEMAADAFLSERV